jgi:hypothetical protein
MQRFESRRLSQPVRLHRVTYQGRSKPRGTAWFRTLEFPVTAGSRWRVARSAMIYPTEIEALRAVLLDAFDRQRQVDIAARLVARHLTLGHPPRALSATLGRALLRETRVFTPIRCWRPGCVSSGWSNASEAHPARRRPLSCRSFAYRARYCPPAHARRGASSGSHPGENPPTGLGVDNR